MLGSKAIIVYSIITVYTFCKPLHIRILRNGNIPKASSWPQDNHKCLVIFVLLIWHGMVESAYNSKYTALHIYRVCAQREGGGDGLILFPKEYNIMLTTIL